MAPRTARKKKPLKNYVNFLVTHEEMERLKQAAEQDRQKRRLRRPTVAGFIRVAALDAADAILAEQGSV